MAFNLTQSLDYALFTTKDQNLAALSSTPHPIPGSVNIVSNSIFGTLYVLCFLLGVPGNLLAYFYFSIDLSPPGASKHCRSVNRSYFDSLYKIVCLTDIVICATVVPNALSFFSAREEAWFGNHIFCGCWGLLWEILPYFSVALVGVMSVSRLLILVWPLLQLNPTIMFWSVSLYGTYLTLRSIIPVSLSLAEYIYDTTDVFCFELTVPASAESQMSQIYWKFNTMSRLLQLAFPIIPIILCSTAIISTLLIISRRKRAVVQSSAHASATVTVLLFTGLYVLCNLPVCANYVLMVLALSDGCEDECYHNKYKDNDMLVWFSWNFTYVLCVAVNSTANPVLYHFRMLGFGDFLVKKIFEPVLAACLEMCSRNSAEPPPNMARVSKSKAYTEIVNIA